MDYEKKYKEALEMAQKLYQDCPNGKNDRIYHTTDLEKMFPELKEESEDEQIRKELITFFQRFPYTNLYDAGLNAKDVLAWLEKQGKPNPYSGTSFDYNGNTWGMCARDNGVDILFNGKIIQYIPQIEK